MASASFNRSVSVCRSTSAKVTLPEEFAQEVRASDICGVSRYLSIEGATGQIFQRQEIKFPRPIHITSPSFGLEAGAKIEVGALRTADRAAGILIQNETSKGLPTNKLACGIENRPFCNDEGQRAFGKKPRISGDGPAGCKRNFKIPQRAFL